MDLPLPSPKQAVSHRNFILRTTFFLWQDAAAVSLVATAEAKLNVARYQLLNQLKGRKATFTVHPSRCSAALIPVARVARTPAALVLAVNAARQIMTATNCK